MSKLTAKLSDGREFEVLCQSLTVGGGAQHLTVIPLKPEPPEEIFVRLYSDGSISASYRTMTEAIAYTRGYSGPSNIYRYTLAPEPEPEQKKPREWWAVYDADLCASRMFKSEKAAKTYRLNDVVHRGHPFLVREVEE